MAIDKEWVKEALALFQSLPSDTTPDRIKENRKKMLVHATKAQALKDSGVNNVALDKFLDWFHYFDLGYKSEYNIDTLPQDIEGKLAKFAVSA